MRNVGACDELLLLLLADAPSITGLTLMTGRLGSCLIVVPYSSVTVTCGMLDAVFEISGVEAIVEVVPSRRVSCLSVQVSARGIQ